MAFHRSGLGGGRRGRHAVVGLAVAHERFVMHEGVQRVLPLPTAAAEVPEASGVTAEVRPLLHATLRTRRIFQVRIHLHLFGKLWSFDFDESGRHGLHVALVVIERDSSGTDRVLVLVRVDAGVDDAAEKIVHDVPQTFGRQHPMKGTHEYRLVRIETLRRTFHEITVADHPRNDLHLFGAHSATGYLEVPIASVGKVVSGRLQQGLHVLFRFEQYVDVTFGRIRRVLFTRPFDLNRSERFESVHEGRFRDVPWNAAQKYFARVRGIPVQFHGQLSAPRTRRIEESGGRAVHSGGSIERRRFRYARCEHAV